MRACTLAARIIGVCGAALGAVPAPAVAGARHVPSEYATINMALDASASGDTVLVAPGTYTDWDARDLGTGATWTSCAFLVDGVVLRSTHGPAQTVIDMVAAPPPQRFVVLSLFNQSDVTAVEGFTITADPLGGTGVFMTGELRLSGCIFRDLDAGNSSGGGIAANGDLRVEDCEFLNCVGSALGGGAISHWLGRIELVRSVIRQCGNRAVELNGTSPVTETALVEDCAFLDNWGGSAAGLGFDSYAGEVIVRRCTFVRNVAHGTGAGGLGISNYAPTLVEDCLFVENRTDGDNGQGGAMSVTGQPSAIVRNCTFVDNSQTYTGIGGSTLRVASSATLSNCIIAGSSGHVAIYVDPGSFLTTTCNVFWDNPWGIGIPLSATDLQADPLFCSPDTGDFTLAENSPCLPAQTPCGQIGAFGQGCTGISVDPVSWARLKGLFRGRTEP